MFCSIKIRCAFTILLLLAVNGSLPAQTIPYNVPMPDITYVNAALPITFSWINYDETADEVPQPVINKIETIIVDFFLEMNGGDTTGISNAKDGYFNTVRTYYNNLQLFIVILKTPLSYSHCKLFLYDSVSNTVSRKAIDYNTWAMYSIDGNNIMARSGLFKSLHFPGNDISLKSQSRLLLKRLDHNRNSNVLEEISYRANGLSLDTASFKIKTPESP